MLISSADRALRTTRGPEDDTQQTGGCPRTAAAARRGVLAPSLRRTRRWRLWALGPARQRAVTAAAVVAARAERALLDDWPNQHNESTEPHHVAWRPRPDRVEPRSTANQQNESTKPYHVELNPDQPQLSQTMETPRERPQRSSRAPNQSALRHAWRSRVRAPLPSATRARVRAVAVAGRERSPRGRCSIESQLAPPGRRVMSGDVARRAPFPWELRTADSC